MLNKTLRDQYLQAAKELRRYFNGELYRAYPPDRAFVKWYTVARFGRLSDGDCVFGDGKSDGGIDAIVFHEGGAVVFQMKYEKVPHIGSVSRDELAGFEKVAKLLTEKQQRDDFDLWLSTIRPDLCASYRKVFEMPAGRVRFVFVTSKYTEFRSVSVEIQDIQKILSLWSLFREGFTPPTESIRLVMENTWHAGSRGGVATYVGLADVQDFLRLMRDDRNDRLFAQNVRTDTHSQINDRIRETYEDSPEEFWLGNNGIYIVCREVTTHGSRFDLTFPSIINGSQTLHSIADSQKRHSCKILVRILEMDVIGNPKLLREIIRRTNTQNTMKLVNLVAHDPFQLNIALYLDKFQVFYERREREWSNEKRNILAGYLPIKSKELGQWLSVLERTIGLGRARSRVSELFDQNLRYYGKLFGDLDSEFRSPKYRELLVVVWAGLLVRNFVRNAPRKKRALYQIPRLLLIRAVSEAALGNKVLQAKIGEALRMHRIGRRRFPPQILARLESGITKLSAVQKRAQKRDDGLDYSNFFKLDESCARAFAAAFAPATVRSLGGVLLRNIDAIE